MEPAIRHKWIMPQPPSAIWEYLTKPELLEQWLMKNDFKPVVGHRFSFHAGPVPAMQFDGMVHCEVLMIVPEKKLTYSWKFGPEPGKIILDTIVTWTLSPHKEGTKLKLEHTSFRDPDHEFAYQVMFKGWDDNVRKKMQRMTNTKSDYHATILVSTDAPSAFQEICRVEAWWTIHFSGSAKKKGDEFYVPFGETWAKFTVTEIIPDKTIKWQVLECNLHHLKNKEEWKGTEILWEISERKDSTEIRMTHIGLNPSLECFEDCTGGWNHYVRGSLASLMNDGVGKPDHPEYSAKDRQ